MEQRKMLQGCSLRCITEGDRGVAVDVVVVTGAGVVWCGTVLTTAKCRSIFFNGSNTRAIWAIGAHLLAVPI